MKRMKKKRRAQKQNKPPRRAQSFHPKTLGKACVRKVRVWAGSVVLGGRGALPCGPMISFFPSLRLFWSSPVAAELPASGSR